MHAERDGEARSLARSKNELNIYTALAAVYQIGHVTEDFSREKDRPFGVRDTAAKAATSSGKSN
jgi:hypothetical protein